MPRPLLRRVALAALTLLLVAGAVEAGARVGWTYEDTVLSEPNERLRDHPTRLFELRPGWSSPTEGFTVNADGFRGPPLRSAAEGRTRVLLLGESSTMGAGVRDQEVYARQLDALLEAARPGRYEVVNAGVGAWTIWQSRVLLEEEIERLHPQVVIPYHQANDFLPTGVVDEHNFLYEVKLTDKELWARRKPLAPLLTLLYRSRAYLVLRKNVLLDEARALPTMQQRPTGTGRRVPDTDRREAWETIVALCAEHGVTLLPAVPAYRDLYASDHLIQQVAQAHGLRLVDLGAARRRAGIPEDSFFLDAMHPNARGHRFLAEQLAPVVLEVAP